MDWFEYRHNSVWLLTILYHILTAFPDEVFGLQ
jgi:hypothetical protein